MAERKTHHYRLKASLGGKASALGKLTRTGDTESGTVHGRGEGPLVQLLRALKTDKRVKIETFAVDTVGAKRAKLEGRRIGERVRYSLGETRVVGYTDFLTFLAPGTSARAAKNAAIVNDAASRWDIPIRVRPDCVVGDRFIFLCDGKPDFVMLSSLKTRWSETR